MTLAILILVAFTLMGVSVLLAIQAHEPEPVLGDDTLLPIVVHLEDGLQMRGRQVTHDAHEIVLVDAVLLPPGQGETMPIDGRVRVPRMRVELIQELTGPLPLPDS